jgi:NAD(P)-dependent dehydrogenase (short-subunit alcohol dehydrogenase family)
MKIPLHVLHVPERMSKASAKVALVTGGASGIGRASAIEFYRQVFTTIVIVDIEERGAEETCRIIKAGPCSFSAASNHCSSLDPTYLMKLQNSQLIK